MTFQFLGLKYNEGATLTVSLVIRWFSELLDYCDVKDTDRLEMDFTRKCRERGIQYVVRQKTKIVRLC